MNSKIFVPLLLLIGLLMAETEKLERISLKEDPNAVCNDGTPAIYYWKKSPTGSNRWLLFLTGGEACVNKEMCEERWTVQVNDRGHYLMSSTMWPDKYDKYDGVLSPNKNESALWDANKAVLIYCSSDYFIGQYGGKNSTQDEHFGWKFRGQTIVNAFIKHLVNHQGLGGKNETQTVVFGGSSAGAVGGMFHLDAVSNILKPLNVRTLGFLDSPLYFDKNPIQNNSSPIKPALNTMAKKVFELYHYDSNDDSKECMNAFKKEEHWKCYLGQYRLHYIKTPFILYTDQYDDYHIQKDMGKSPIWDKGHLSIGQLEHVKQFRMDNKKYLKEFEFNKTNGVIYSAAVGWHAYTGFENFYKLKNHQNESENDVLLKTLKDFENNKDFRIKYIDE